MITHLSQPTNIRKGALYYSAYKYSVHVSIILVKLLSNCMSKIGNIIEKKIFNFSDQNEFYEQ